MDTLRFAHRYFHFHLPQWKSFWEEREPNPEELFSKLPFSPRSLKCGQPNSFGQALAEFRKAIEQEDSAGIRAVHQGSPEYPTAIFQYLAPERQPPLLYLRGVSISPEENCVAIVGTRFPSPQGADAAACFSSYFSALNIKVVSGLAKGIDTIAHRENLRIGTVAVLGSGVRGVYPGENEKLAEEILARGGSLISPFPIGQTPLPQNFPIRNEIIAALAIGTVVIEGAETSGAAVTGKQALGMGKTVVALAQDFRSGFGRGAIRLQQAGASLATSEEEALHAIYFRVGGYSGTKLPNVGKGRKREFTFEEFQKAAGKDVGAAMVLLEEGISSGKIERSGPDFYRLLPRLNRP